MRLRPAPFANSFAVAAVAVLSLGTAAPAFAAACPTVMLILDRSGSMDEDPSGGGSTPSKMDIAKTALNKLVSMYGDQLPFGFESFAATGFGSDCNVGVNVVVKPMNGSKASVTSAITAVATEGSTNTGPAIDAAIKLPEMHDANRPGSYIVLVTDGEPNCAGNVGTETSEPAYTIGAIKRAAAAGIKTFVIGFGALPPTDKAAMNQMAAAGLEPYTGTACNGQQYYAAESNAALSAAITSIAGQIVGEFGGVCDDSCYSNGCPNAGEICVKGACVPDPCAALRQTCAATDFCYTDGTSAGTCTPSCPATCPAGQACTLNGCAVDPCAGVTCDATTYCKSGTCVASSCKTCDANLYCINGVCKNDPCRYVQCPMGATCTAEKGTCVAGTSGDGTGTNHGRASGCYFAAGQHADQAVFVFGLLALVAVAARRRRRAA